MGFRVVVLVLAAAALPLQALADGAAPPAPVPPTEAKAPEPAAAAPAPAAAPAAAPAPDANAPAAAAPAATPAVTPPGTADEQFDMRVRGLEEHVNTLKEKIFRTKSRLLLLNEKVMGGDLLTGSSAIITHVNDMGGTYVLETIAYTLDGVPLLTKVDVNGDLSGRDEMEIFRGRIVPGKHILAVRAVYRGSGFGVFSYLKGYRFNVQGSTEFNADGGKATNVRVVNFERGGITTDVKDRPSVRWDISAQKDVLPGKKDDAKP